VIDIRVSEPFERALPIRWGCCLIWLVLVAFVVVPTWVAIILIGREIWLALGEL
jgi:hypothetical protein